MRAWSNCCAAAGEHAGAEFDDDPFLGGHRGSIYSLVFNQRSNEDWLSPLRRPGKQPVYADVFIKVRPLNCITITE